MTPGPWECRAVPAGRWGSQELFRYVLVVPGTNRTMPMVAHQAIRQQDEADANARAMGAVPSLVGALEQIAVLAEWHTTLGEPGLVPDHAHTQRKLTDAQVLSMRKSISTLARAALAIAGRITE